MINFKMNNAKSERVIEIDSCKSTKHEEKYDIDCRRTPRFGIGDVVMWICLLLRRRLRLLYRKGCYYTYNSFIILCEKIMSKCGEHFLKPRGFRISEIYCHIELG